MRKLLISLVAVFALAACSSGGSDTGTEEVVEIPVTETAMPVEAEVAAADLQTGDVELVGALGCGHCTYSVGESCTAAVQTADGAVYILESADSGEELYEQRLDGKTITVQGVAVERDGVGYVTVSAFEL